METERLKYQHHIKMYIRDAKETENIRKRAKEEGLSLSAFLGKCVDLYLSNNN